jgi:hypothetical protein
MTRQIDEKINNIFFIDNSPQGKWSNLYSDLC